MKKFTLTAALFGLLLFSFAVSVGASSGWSQTYGGADADGALSLIQTADGGYVLAGYTHSFGSGEEDFWLVKVDSSSNTQWNRTYGGTESEYAFSVITTSDGGYTIAGYTYSVGAENSDA